MSYEDLEEAPAKGKGKRGQKRKSTVPEPDAPETKAKVAPMSEA